MINNFHLAVRVARRGPHPHFLASLGHSSSSPTASTRSTQPNPRRHLTSSAALRQPKYDDAPVSYSRGRVNVPAAGRERGPSRRFPSNSNSNSDPSSSSGSSSGSDQYSGGPPAAPGARTASLDSLTNSTLRELYARSLLQDVSSSHLNAHLDAAPRTIYLGIDPTADSLHVGHLLPILALARLVRAGHRGVILIGGATGSIGDPSGRSTERPDLPKEKLERNVQRLKAQVEEIVQRLGSRHGRDAEESEAERIAVRAGEAEETPMFRAAQAGTGAQAEAAAEAVIGGAHSDPTSPAAGSQSEGGEAAAASSVASSTSSRSLDIRVLDNADFYKGLGFIDFLREVGRFVRMGDVLARDSVKGRLPPPYGRSLDPHAGMSYTEMSYQLLQAYDFLYMHNDPSLRCSVQLGGSDQMGNIGAGIELIRRKRADPSLEADTLRRARDPDLRAGKDLGLRADIYEPETARSRRPPPAFGITMPLLVGRGGAKLGKSAGNAVWIDRSKCSDYDFYQYFLRAQDDDVDQLLRTLTFLTEEEVERRVDVLRREAEAEAEGKAEGERADGAEGPTPTRPAAALAGLKQKVLAREMVLTFRGEAALSSAERITELLHRTLKTEMQPSASAFEAPAPPADSEPEPTNPDGKKPRKKGTPGKIPPSPPLSIAPSPTSPYPGVSAMRSALAALPPADRAAIWRDLAHVADSSKGSGDPIVKRVDPARVFGRQVVDVFMLAGLVPTKTQTWKIFRDAGIWMNNTPVDMVLARKELREEQDLVYFEPEPEAETTPEVTPGAEGQAQVKRGMIVFRKGKKHVRVFLLEWDPAALEARRRAREEGETLGELEARAKAKAEAEAEAEAEAVGEESTERKSAGPDAA